MQATAHSIVGETGQGRRRIADYLELTKPRLTALVLVATAAGFWAGAPSGTRAMDLIPVLLGTWLVVGGANALNQWIERLPDAAMPRTKGRPLPSGRLRPDEALHVGLWSTACGITLLGLLVNALAAGLAALAAVVYVAAYTPLKRASSLCTLVGAIPGALPPVIGWAAARDRLDPEAWALFAILFVWQLPHFLALASLFRDEYARAGFRILSVTDVDGRATARQTILYALVLVPVSLVPTLVGLTGAWYFYGALALSVGFLAAGVRAALHQSRAAMQRLFVTSVVYLPLLLGLMACDKVIR